MTPENRDIILQLLDRHRALGISEQIDYAGAYMDSLIVYSASLVDLRPEPIVPKMANKEDFTNETIVRQFGFTATTAKRYLRQLTECGYLESHDGNRNRTYRLKTTISE